MVLLTAGCATQLKIETDSDKVYDLSSYSTFSIEAFDAVSYTHLTLPTKA